jgi:hypothetical protein
MLPIVQQCANLESYPSQSYRPQGLLLWRNSPRPLQPGSMLKCLPPDHVHNRQASGVSNPIDLCLQLLRHMRLPCFFNHAEAELTLNTRGTSIASCMSGSCRVRHLSFESGLFILPAATNIESIFKRAPVDLPISDLTRLPWQAHRVEVSVPVW